MMAKSRDARLIVRNLKFKATEVRGGTQRDWRSHARVWLHVVFLILPAGALPRPTLRPPFTALASWLRFACPASPTILPPSAVRRDAREGREGGMECSPRHM